MDFEEKIILMLSSGLIGILASAMTLCIKERFDRTRAKRKIIQFRKEVEEYRNIDKTIPMNSDHPLAVLVRMKQNLSKEFKKDSDWNDDIRDKIRLYLDIDSQLLKHSEYLIRIQKETAKKDVVIKNA
jgi:hypothetical protein